MALEDATPDENLRLECLFQAVSIAAQNNWNSEQITEAATTFEKFVRGTS